ncbi:unnamed protein product [Echinostoma caproni]|uniref:Guanylate kinase-like domain-containing protein n=1 Tax=Echinostoma caproni TaxID=27848 RepID=A0A183B245_9TREM|nr:unnamed protein product [Echinostoma caproni]
MMFILPNLSFYLRPSTSFVVSTLQSTSTPYPILALIGPAGSLKHQLTRMLVEKAGDFFAALKLHTDRPSWWQAVRERKRTGHERDTKRLRKGPRLSSASVDSEILTNSLSTGAVLPESDHFEHVTPDEFDQLRARGEFVQTARIQNYQYGLTWSALETVARHGLAGIFTGELESMTNLRLTSLQPRFILCLPEDRVLHENRLRPGLVEDAVKQQNDYIQWCLNRASNVYPQFYRENPGWFDAPLNTTNLEEAFNQLLLIVMDYLGISPEDLALNNQTEIPVTNLKASALVDPNTNSTTTRSSQVGRHSRQPHQSA